MDILKWVLNLIISMVRGTRRKPSDAQQQSGGVGSQNIQVHAGGNVNITQEGRSDFLQKVKHEAATKFRSAFAETITQITDGSMDPHYLIMRHKVQHDAAIFEFRPFVDPDQLSDFDATAKKYSECRSALKPAMLQYYRSENTGQPVDQSSKFNLIVAIKGLLAFADNP